MVSVANEVDTADLEETDRGQVDLSEMRLVDARPAPAQVLVPGEDLLVEVGVAPLRSHDLVDRHDL